MTAWLLICGKNALEMAEKCIFQTNANEKRAVVKRLSFNQLLLILSNVQQAITSQCSILCQLIINSLRLKR